MKDFFEELFEYNKNINEKLIDVMLNKNKVPLRAMQLISHILLVHESWNNRMLGKSGLNNFWKDMHLNDTESNGLRLYDFWKAIYLNKSHDVNICLYNRSKSIIANNDLSNKVIYKNSKGAEFSNTFQDILFHLINHGTHHRGQINVLLRNAGIEPVIPDFIFYKR